MYFSIVLALSVFGSAFSAPPEMLTQATDEVIGYEEIPVVITAGPEVYETSKPYEPMVGNEYETQALEYATEGSAYTPSDDGYVAKEVEYNTEGPVYTPSEDGYVAQEVEYPTEGPVYSAPKIEYEVKEPEYAVEDPEPAVVYEVATESSATEEPESRPFHKQTVILNSGKHLSEAITAKIVGPMVLFNSKVAAAAGALPPMLAAKGAVIGAAISTPIQIGAVASSSIVSGVTGKLVAVPISVGTGAVAKFVSAAEEGRQIWDFNIQHGGEVFKNGLIKLGHLVLKPVAVVVGAKTALTGAGVGLFGSGVKTVGVGMEAVGAKMVSSGLVAKGLGHRLIAKNLPPFVK